MSQRKCNQPPELSANARSKPRLFEWAALGFFAVVLVLFRMHAFDLPLEADECNYAYIGERLLAGDRLYVDVWDHQPPGAFVLFAGVGSIFGQTPIVFRWLATAFSLLTLGLLYFLARALGGVTAGMVAAALFAVASADPGTAGEGCNREIFMNTLVCAAWWMTTRACSGGRGWLVVAGAALALASALKTIIAVHWCVLAAWFVWQGWRSVGRRGAAGSAKIQAAARDMLAFGMGPALLWGGMWVYFDQTQRLAEFLDAVFLFNLSYSDDSVGYFHRFVRFFSPPRVDFIFDSAAPLWYGSIAALAWLALKGVGLFRPGATATAPGGGKPAGSGGGASMGRVSLIFAFVVAGYVAICLPGQFWPHYYYLLFPPMILAIGVAAADLARYVVWRERVAGGGLSNERRLLAVLACAALPVLLLATEYVHYLRLPLADITLRRYNTRDFWGRAQGENLRRVTEPSDRVFVYSNDPSIYYYSGRRCASRYTMITGLSEGYAGVERRREILIQELERDPPRVVLLLSDEVPFDAWVEFLHRYYGRPDSDVPVAVGSDLHDHTGKPIMLVLARKDQPIEEIDWDWDRSSLYQN